MSHDPSTPPGPRPGTLPAVPRQRRPRWAEPDPVDQLADRHREFVAAAVHPDEIAALLESDGMSDDRTRERYGCRNSFALAEELYERVERAHPEPAGPAPDPWRIGLLGCLLRGVVFALPGLAYVLGAPLLTGPRDGSGLPAGTVPLLAGALCGWMWNQGLAHRAYSWLGLGDGDACRRSLAVGAPAGALLCTAVACLAAGDGDPGAVVFAAGEACYLGAATVLLVLGRERALLHSLSPMAAGALFALVQPVPVWARLSLLAGSLVAVVLLATHEVAPAVRQSRFRGVTLPGAAGGSEAKAQASPRLAASLPYAFFGLGIGVLVLYAAVGDLIAHEGSGSVATPAAVALTLSMGPAEWLLYRFRSGGLAGLRSTSTPGAFWRATTVTLVQCLAGYLVSLLVLAHATAGLWPDAPRLDAVHFAGLLLLGAVLWTGLLLQSFGAVLGAAAVCCATALAQTLALATHPGDPHGAGLLVYGGAAALQACLVCGLLGRATAHR
ncbi:hypothetical protein [Streptomyces griseiscabiei]|uniref:Integral membrane protein n=2 Tax=Streptomyces griseiscabiei TaxID=2993540 RepID=A0ABU4KVR7_9ACTN|nr:hypothetical protein [Streptomyces griseiscabiei]MBZ3903239.1 hypothetical protein [Streptomyces griseiscabiei]MDX2907550.1 hypothetical protein [Streptomyces griseiscabiei]